VSTVAEGTLMKPSLSCEDHFFSVTVIISRGMRDPHLNSVLLFVFRFCLLNSDAAEKHFVQCYFVQLHIFEQRKFCVTLFSMHAVLHLMGL